MRLFFLSAAILLACNQSTVIDGTSDDSFSRSFISMQKSLSSELSDSIEIVYKSLVQNNVSSDIMNFDLDQTMKQIRNQLHGMDANGIFQLWDSIQHVNYAKEKAVQDSLQQVEENRKDLLSILTIELLDKKVSIGTWSDRILYKFRFSNNGEKDISAFKGEYDFMDQFDEVIKKMSLKYEKSIRSNTSVIWEAESNYNDLDNDDVRLGSLSLDRLKTTWMPESIIFEDGSKLEVDLD